MEQEFQRADFEQLLGGDELLDGQELSCGFVRVAAVGLLMNYRPERGEEPLFDMNFNRGKPLLPFPFTLEQFKAFCAWHPAFKWEVIDSEFTNSFCKWHAGYKGNASDALNWPPDNDAILELQGRNQASAVLVRSILGISPETEVTESASGGIETKKTWPLPLATGDIAFCFAGLRWNEEQWKKPLGDKPKWLAACIAIPGMRGVSETRWSPVLIGAALVHYGHAEQKSVRARFQTMPQLAPWLDAWKTYEADNSDIK